MSREISASRHNARYAEEAAEFVERRLPELGDVLSIGRAQEALREALSAVSAVDCAIANVTQASQALDAALAKLDEANKRARKAGDAAFKSTPVVSSDLGDEVTHIDDLRLGVRVHVQTRYGTKVGEGDVSQILAPLVWIGDAIYSADDYMFISTRRQNEPPP